MKFKISDTETDTSWRAGRFDASTGREQVLFGRMYEDVEIERGAFPPGSRVFAIASAGCTAIRLSAEHDVTAVDINPVQLAYARRRAGGAPIEIGSVERMMMLGRKAFPLMGWTRGRLDTFLSLDETHQQNIFWQKHLNTWRFRQSFDMATSRALLGLIYAASFLRIMPSRIGPILRARMECCWSMHPNATNHYARTLFLDDPSADSCLESATTIRFACADAANYLENCPRGSFDAFTLSNVLDGATEAYRHRLFAAVKQAATPGAIVVIRSFANPDAPLPSNYAAQDRSMLWGITEVKEVEAL
jgi:S-adenosylmethionine:diacylglycerol 3-amino-3-carboxypropyl transferase